MKINITKNSRRLETISKGDILIFPDREEIVREVDKLIGNLYTGRFVDIPDENFQIQMEFVVYLRGRIFPESKGRVYNYIKMKKMKYD